MPASLLDSQFEVLEEPTPDENAIVVSIEPRPGEIIDTIAGILQLQSAALPRSSDESDAP